MTFVPEYRSSYRYTSFEPLSLNTRYVASARGAVNLRLNVILEITMQRVVFRQSPKISFAHYY